MQILSDRIQSGALFIFRAIDEKFGLVIIKHGEQIGFW
jgi:hypothetical protein